MSCKWDTHTQAATNNQKSVMSSKLLSDLLYRKLYLSVPRKQITEHSATQKSDSWAERERAREGPSNIENLHGEITLSANRITKKA